MGIVTDAKDYDPLRLNQFQWDKKEKKKNLKVRKMSS